MKNKKHTGMGCLVVILIMILLGFFFNSIISQSESSVFSQTGYFKDNNKMRVFSIQIKPNTLSQDSLFKLMRKFASKAAHTKGRATHVFFFKNQAPDITLEKTFDRAYERCLIYEPYYLFSKQQSGKMIYIKHPKN